MVLFNTLVLMLLDKFVPMLPLAGAVSAKKITSFMLN